MSIKKWLKNKQKTTKKLWFQYEAKIVLLVSFILVSVLSFEVGTIKNQEINQTPIIIEKPVLKGEKKNNPPVATASHSLSLEKEKKESSINTDVIKKGCLFVGSKNSTMYHLPTSSYAKRIKSENLVCFSSQNEAESKGYKPDKSLAR